MFQLEVFWRSRRKKEERTSDILNLQISVRSSFSECGVSKKGEGWDENGRLQISKVTELPEGLWCILFRKTKNIILNTKITVQLKRPALASHSSVPEVGDSMSQDSREQGLYTQRRACTGDFSQPELPSPATRFHGLLACISTNGSLMGGLVTLDRNPSQYYRDWGYSSILVLHTPPLDRAKGGSMS